MTCHLVPTLEALLWIRIGVELWSLADIKDTLVQLLALAELDWKTILHEMHKKIRLKILTLPLPDAQKKQLLWIVKPIGVQIQAWLGRYKYLFLSSNQRIRASVNCICWTSNGTVDEMKSTSLLLDSKVLDVISSYKLACSFCLEGYVAFYWQKLRDHKMDVKSVEKVGSRQSDALASFWTDEMKDGPCKLTKHTFDSEKYCFFNAVRANNVCASKYFWHMLEPGLNEEERESILLKSLIRASHFVYERFEKPPFYYPMHFRSSLVFYLYMKLNQSSRLSFFSDHLNNRKAIMGLLLAFLNWPFQEIFLNLNAYFWSLSPPVDDYVLLVRFICGKIEAEKENFDPNILDKIWFQIPSKYMYKEKI